MNWENIIKEDSRFEREKDRIRRRKQRALERRRLKGKAVRGQEKRDMSYFLKRVDELKKTIKELQTMSKDFDAEKRESMNRTIKGLEKEIEKIMSIALDD
jgi:phage host-nuclease inhibitor protein Gam